MSEPGIFRGLSLYLFAAGAIALLVVPFLPWFSYGLNFLFPSQVSLVYLFERGFWPDLTFYLLGVAAALAVTAAARRPVVFVGMLPAIFPLFTLFVFTIQPLLREGQYYTDAFTIGVFTALFGSALLESSYFAYREKELVARKDGKRVVIERP